MRDSRIAVFSHNTVRILFILLMTAIVAVTILIDRRVSGSALNASILTTVPHANIWYYLAALLIGAGVICLLRKTPPLSSRGFYIIGLIVVFLVCIWQCFVSRWMPVDDGVGDWASVRLAAMDLSGGVNCPIMIIFWQTPIMRISRFFCLFYIDWFLIGQRLPLWGHCQRISRHCWYHSRLGIIPAITKRRCFCSASVKSFLE